LAALVAVGWAYRGAGRRRAAVWGAAVAVLLAGDMGAWRALEHYAYRTPAERAWARAVRTGDDQGTTAAARAIGRAVRRAHPGTSRILAEEGPAAAAIVLSERPGA